MRKPALHYHRSDLSRELLLVKCPCRQIIHVPVGGCECQCGRRHVRCEELPVRKRRSGGEG